MKPIIVLADQHFPFADRRTIEWSIEYIKEVKPSRIVLLGDLIDFYSISHFTKDPSKRNLKKEVDSAREYIAKIDSLNYDTTYIKGNHEHRWEKYVWDKAPELVGLDEVSFNNLLRIPDRWQVVGYNKRVIHGNIVFFHGDKCGAGLFDKNLQLGMSSICGHSHLLGVKYRRMADYRIIAAASSGCQCSYEVDFTTFSNWQRGLCICYSSKDIRTIVSPF